MVGGDRIDQLGCDELRMGPVVYIMLPVYILLCYWCIYYCATGVSVDILLVYMPPVSTTSVYTTAVCVVSSIPVVYTPVAQWNIHQSYIHQ